VPGGKGEKGGFVRDEPATRRNINMTLFAMENLASAQEQLKL